MGPASVPFDADPAWRRGADRRELHVVPRRRFLVLSLSSILLLVGTPARAASPTRILAFGDSLTSGYGLAEEDSFPAQLERALTAAGLDVKLINGGVAGDTSAGGLARLDWSLADKPDLVILELGSNDGLRGLDPAATRKNLAQILTRLAQLRIPSLLIGMKAPRNLGPDYVAAFDPIYEELAREFQVSLDPFFLDGVAGDPALNQSDGIHPNAKGVALIVKRVAPEVIVLIKARQEIGQN
jgi:acyl-CoA thioesterase-1